MDLRLYIDEVGNADLDRAADDPNVRYLALTGIMAVRDQHDRIIVPMLDRVKGLLPSPSTGRPLVLHRREIMRREATFAPLRDPETAAEFDAALLAALRSAPYLAVTVQIDKRLHWETYGVWHYHPYHYCLRCLIERYILYLRRHHLRGDVVIEPRFKKADKKLKASFERIYDGGTENIPARPSARRMRFEREGMPLPDDFGSAVAQILVDRRYARNPKTHAIEGWGTKWLPK